MQKLYWIFVNPGRNSIYGTARFSSGVRHDDAGLENWGFVTIHVISGIT